MEEWPIHTPPRLLVVMAHPDDGEFMCGGALAQWTRRGYDLYYCLMTNGDCGSSDPEMTSEKLVPIRRNESQLASDRLGGTHPVIFLNHVDSQLLPTIDARRDVTRVIRQIQPEIVVTQDPTTYYSGQGYINHPDHRMVGEITFAAIMPSASTRLIFPELLAEGLEPYKVKELYLTNTHNPDRWLELAQEDLTRQVEALQSHQSQISGDPTERIEANARADAAEARLHGHDFTFADSFKFFRFR